MHEGRTGTLAITIGVFVTTQWTKLLSYCIQLPVINMMQNQDGRFSDF